jgi:hypothetical protein
MVAFYRRHVEEKINATGLSTNGKSPTIASLPPFAPSLSKGNGGSDS